jgi:hypothetical protein
MVAAPRTESGDDAEAGNVRHEAIEHHLMGRDWEQSISAACLSHPDLDAEVLERTRQDLLRFPIDDYAPKAMELIAVEGKDPGTGKWLDGVEELVLYHGKPYESHVVPVTINGVPIPVVNRLDVISMPQVNTIKVTDWKGRAVTGHEVQAHCNAEAVWQRYCPAMGLNPNDVTVIWQARGIPTGQQWTATFLPTDRPQVQEFIKAAMVNMQKAEGWFLSGQKGDFPVEGCEPYTPGKHCSWCGFNLTDKCERWKETVTADVSALVPTEEHPLATWTDEVLWSTMDVLKEQMGMAEKLKKLLNAEQKARVEKGSVIYNGAEYYWGDENADLGEQWHDTTLVPFLESIGVSIGSARKIDGSVLMKIIAAHRETFLSWLQSTGSTLETISVWDTKALREIFATAKRGIGGKGSKEKKAALEASWKACYTMKTYKGMKSRGVK